MAFYPEIPGVTPEQIMEIRKADAIHSAEIAMRDLLAECANRAESLTDRTREILRTVLKIKVYKYLREIAEELTCMWEFSNPCIPCLEVKDYCAEIILHLLPMCRDVNYWMDGEPMGTAQLYAEVGKVAEYLEGVNK